MADSMVLVVVKLATADEYNDSWGSMTSPIYQEPGSGGGVGSARVPRCQVAPLPPVCSTHSREK